MSARLKLLGIALACAAPVVLATLAYYFDWAPGATGNYGELIQPTALAGAPFDELRGKWVLVSFDSAACDAACERKLYYMRQTRKAQGKEQGRVERLWVMLDEGAPREELAPLLEGVRVARSTKADLSAFPGQLTEHLYLIDPLGNLMLRFPPDPDPRRIIKDLQRLLKYSRIG